MNSFEELGTLLGKGPPVSQSKGEPAGSPRRSQLTECGSVCTGSVYHVYDELRDIETTADTHPGVLCKRREFDAVFSMGTDVFNVNEQVLSEYWLVHPSDKNGLRKSTAFKRDSESISLDFLASLPAIGQLDKNDCRSCQALVHSSPLRQA